MSENWQGGSALLIAVAVVVALRERQPVSKLEAPVAQTPAEVRVKAVERKVETLDFGNAEAAKGATRYLCSAKRRCIVYVVMFCASRDHESWQGVASLRDATRKGVEQLTRKSFSIRFSRALPTLLIVCDSCECPSRSDGPPVGWPGSERIACRGLHRPVDAGANTYTQIYALCADVGTLPYPCINRQLHPKVHARKSNC